MIAKRWQILAAVGAVLVSRTAQAQELEGTHAKKEGGGEAKGEGKEEGRLPVSVPERGITLGNMILSPAVDFDVTHISLGTTSASALGWSVGARLGIGADFDFGVIPLVLEDEPDTGDFKYVGPAVQATYRFVNIKNTFELGARIIAQFSTPKPASMVLTPAIPIRIHIAKIASLDTGVTLPIGVPFSGGGSTVVGLTIPATFLIDVVEPVFHLGLGTGFGIADFNDAGKTTFIPLTFLAGFAIPGKNGPIVDIDPFFSFPNFVTPGANGDKIVSQLWQTGVAIEGYFYL